MVKRRPARRASKSSSSASKRTPRAVASTGPVSLAQARAAATLQAPVAAAAASAVSVLPPSPASVGLERRKLQQKQAAERRRRIQEYKATLTIMKQRGLKGPRPPKGAQLTPAMALAVAPLQILAEGDSWFDYPVPRSGGGIIPRLEKKLGVPILNLAKAGDEVRYMLGVKERKGLIEQLTKGCPAGGPWDALLFSGGGNDIVDNPMALWVRDYNPLLPPAALVHQARYDAALALVRAGYEDLITLRDSLSPGTRLFFHDYDFAIPDGRGVCFLGPWLKPTFDLRGFPTLASRSAVTAVLLQQFAAMLLSLTSVHANVTFINGQGTLPPQSSSWANELHPAKKGFDAFAGLFYDAIKAAFPSRVV